MAAAAAGTITLTRAPPVCPTTKKMTNPTIEFWAAAEGGFNPSQCLSRTLFTVRPNQKYVLVTNLVAPPVILNKDAPLEFDDRKYRLCYRISMKEKGMALIVEEKTSLTLLLNSGCIIVEPFLL
jgi:hypothetical protein